MTDAYQGHANSAGRPTRIGAYALSLEHFVAAVPLPSQGDTFQRRSHCSR